MLNFYSLSANTPSYPRPPPPPLGVDSFYWTEKQVVGRCDYRYLSASLESIVNTFNLVAIATVLFHSNGSVP